VLDPGPVQMPTQIGEQPLGSSSCIARHRFRRPLPGWPRAARPTRSGG
jgi:hypothetical protein